MNYEQQDIAVVLNSAEVIKRELTKAVNCLKRDETMSYAKVRVTLSGRTNGDMKLEYEVSDGEYSSNYVSSHNLQSAVDETLRRRGFTKTNAPLMLTSVQVSDEEIPF